MLSFFPYPGDPHFHYVKISSKLDLSTVLERSNALPTLLRSWLGPAQTISKQIMATNKRWITWASEIFYFAAKATLKTCNVVSQITLESFIMSSLNVVSNVTLKTLISWHDTAKVEGRFGWPTGHSYQNRVVGFSFVDLCAPGTSGDALGSSSVELCAPGSPCGPWIDLVAVVASRIAPIKTFVQPRRRCRTFKYWGFPHDKCLKNSHKLFGKLCFREGTDNRDCLFHIFRFECCRCGFASQQHQGLRND